ncbi:hypothetical protein [Qipengyuania qiaonensis]|uniref:Lipoprotein n=1 Tax=Qipengyuania qiaonensis TaxID=2867240 RepID=A0ABS7JAS8_9SPHN|nr:hypothetical protein [Qipengyuania qiaonensis]MBX7483421.1 hypothetical protein [Qipengyuania qiaonensis]
MKRITFAAALPLALAIAACSDRPDSPGEADASETGLVVEPDGGIGDGAGPPEPVTADSIPVAFLGVWDTADGNCAPASTMRTDIGPETMQFYESHGDVTRVEVDSPQRIVVSLTMEGEGERWQMARMFTLSKDGRTLTPSAVDAEEQFDPIPLIKCE